jgi:predicted dehydrogenase
MGRVRVGVLGTGIIIRDYHLLTLRDHPKAEVVAAGNLHRESLMRLAEDFGIPKTYSDFAEMAQAQDIDAVVVGLPNYLHAPVTIQMLEAGKHVLCEKPMAMTVAQAEQMVEASRRTGSKLMIAHMWRFDPEILWLRDVVASGRVGKVFKVKSHAIWLYEGPKPQSWFVQREFAGGGALADMGVHSIDTLRFILGGARPTRVFANMGTHFEQIELEDTATLLLEFEGGIAGLIEAGWYHLYADGLEGYTQVYGTQGYARALPSELHHHVEGVWSVTQPKMRERKQQCDLPMYRAQMDHFLDSILHDIEPTPGGIDGLWAMRILEAAYRSAEMGQAVELPKSKG